MQNILFFLKKYLKDIVLVILKMPSEDIGCYEEISLWLKLGWIKLHNQNK